MPDYKIGIEFDSSQVVQGAKAGADALKGLKTSAKDAETAIQGIGGRKAGDAFKSTGEQAEEAGSGVQKFTKDVKQANQGLSLFAANLASGAVSRGLDLLVTGLSNAARGAINFTRTGISLNEELAKLERGLSVASSGGSQIFDEYISDARRLGTDINATSNAVLRFAAAAENSLSPDAVSEYLEAIQLAGSALGATGTELSLSLRGAEQALGRGKLLAQEFYQITDQLPVSASRFAEELGVSIEQFNEMREKGVLPVEESLAAIARVLKEDFGPVLDAATQSLSRRTQVLTTQIQQISQAVGGALEPTLSSVLGIAEEMVGRFDANHDSIVGLTAASQRLSETLAQNPAIAEAFGDAFEELVVASLGVATELAQDLANYLSDPENVQGLVDGLTGAAEVMGRIVGMADDLIGFLLKARDVQLEIYRFIFQTNRIAAAGDLITGSGGGGGLPATPIPGNQYGTSDTPRTPSPQGGISSRSSGIASLGAGLLANLPEPEQMQQTSAQIEQILNQQSEAVTGNAIQNAERLADEQRRQAIDVYNVQAQAEEDRYNLALEYINLENEARLTGLDSYQRAARSAANELINELTALDSQLRRTEQDLQRSSFNASLPSPSSGGITSGGGGISSILAGVSIAELVKYQPIPGQAFGAPRSYGGHAGIDFDSSIGAGRGGTVLANQGGNAQVIRIGSSAEGGSVQVRVKFVDEQGRDIEQRYNHLSEAAVYQALGIGVGESASVSAGQVLGQVGATDNLSTGAHLDFKTFVNGTPVDPQEYLSNLSVSLGQTTSPLPTQSLQPLEKEIELTGELLEKQRQFAESARGQAIASYIDDRAQAFNREAESIQANNEQLEYLISLDGQSSATIGESTERFAAQQEQLKTLNAELIQLRELEEQGVLSSEEYASGVDALTLAFNELNASQQENISLQLEVDQVLEASAFIDRINNQVLALEARNRALREGRDELSAQEELELRFAQSGLGSPSDEQYQQAAISGEQSRVLEQEQAFLRAYNEQSGILSELRLRINALNEGRSELSNSEKVFLELQKQGIVLSGTQADEVRALSLEYDQLTETLKKTEEANSAISGLESTIGSSFSRMVQDVALGSQSIGDAVLGMVDNILGSLADLALNQFFSSIFSGVFGGGGGFLGGLFGLADGGVLPGPFMPIKAFASGSPNVSRPTLGLVGEGQYPEAIVPLPDGRSIPVQFQGAGGAGQPVTVNTYVTVNNENGDSSVEADQTSEFAERLTARIIEVIHEEKQPGGSLESVER